jgi:sugar transferase EpsL
LALIAISPLLLILSLLVAWKLGWPVFFKQNRPGRHAKPFQMIKFRTMTNERDANGVLLPNEQRMTKLGKLLRSTSLDELPELFNVLKGDMSLVGPRPLLMDYLPHYTERQKMRHLVKPGITGWAQVNGRNAINWDQKLEHDVWYVENQSIWLDLKILLLTPLKVLKRDGISHKGTVGMPRFDEWVKNQSIKEEL